MKAYKSVLSFCLLLVAINRGSALYVPLDEKTVCKNAKLIQYTNYFACVCESGKVHATESECLPPVEKCTKVDELCGEYAKCVLDVDQVTLVCKCAAGYEPNAAKPPVCIPRGCLALDKKCDGGACIKKDDLSAQCGCVIGKKPGTNNDCVDATPVAECKLTCAGDNTACVVVDSKFYDCGCKEGFELKEGKCVEAGKKEEEEEEGDNGSAFPASGILNVGLLFIVSSMVYVLV